MGYFREINHLQFSESGNEQTASFLPLDGNKSAFVLRLGAAGDCDKAAQALNGAILDRVRRQFVNSSIGAETYIGRPIDRLGHLFVVTPADYRNNGVTRLFKSDDRSKERHGPCRGRRIVHTHRRR